MMSCTANDGPRRIDRSGLVGQNVHTPNGHLQWRPHLHQPVALKNASSIQAIAGRPNYQ